MEKTFNVRFIKAENTIFERVINFPYYARIDNKYFKFDGGASLLSIILIHNYEHFEVNRYEKLEDEIFLNEHEISESEYEDIISELYIR